MAVTVVCPVPMCAGDIEIEEEYLAQEVQCPKCGTHLDYEFDEIVTDDGECWPLYLLTPRK